MSSGCPSLRAYVRESGRRRSPTGLPPTTIVTFWVFLNLPVIMCGRWGRTLQVVKRQICGVWEPGCPSVVTRQPRSWKDPRSRPGNRPRSHSHPAFLFIIARSP